MSNEQTVGIASDTLLSFLLNPDSYPHHPRQVELIQTHTAYILRATPYVYKVKKPVNFGFLDFTTLEQRHYACMREVELNRRLCPDLYLGVIPIGLQAGQFTFDSDDSDTQIVEYALKMHELSAQDFLKQRLLRNAVGSAELRRIAARLQVFYQNQPASAAIAECGRIDQLRRVTDENFAQTRDYLGLTISPPAFAAIQHYTNFFYAQHTPLFATRITEGRIVDGHGDLHLEHIHLTDESICIYDCIEFNDRYRYVDVANDVAFLAMDLDYNQRSDLAREFVLLMADALNDPTLLRLMDFYKCWRAYVRGKVESFRGSEPEVPDQERQSSHERARRYFRLALQYAISGSAPTALIIMGGVGSGKSTLAAQLAAELGWPLLSSDRLRKERAGLAVNQRSDAAIRAQLYTPAAKEQTYAVLIEQAEQRAQAGESVLVDATFSRRYDREHLRQRLAGVPVACHFIEAQASAATVRQRLQAREDNDQATSGSDARLEDYETLHQTYEPPTELSPSQLIQVSTESSPAETVTTILTSLATQRVLASSPCADTRSLF